jgi:NAD(P)H-dependent FMN reductase
VRVLLLSGSLQSQSKNVTLLKTAARLAPPGVEAVMFDGLRDLPLYSPDVSPTEPVTTWRQALAESDAVLIASPEYGFSLPGALKNAIDWVIGSGELERKPVAVTAAVNHPDRGRRGLRALLETLSAVSARIVGGEPIVEGNGFETDVADLVRSLVDEATREADEGTHGQAGRLRPAALVSAWVEAFNQGDSDRLASFYAADAVNHQVADSPVQGRDAIRAMFAEGFAEATMVCLVENLLEDGEWAVLEWRDPKGLRGSGFFHVVKGQIVFQRGYWDKLSFLRQQGLPLPSR